MKSRSFYCSLRTCSLPVDDDYTQLLLLTNFVASCRHEVVCDCEFLCPLYPYWSGSGFVELRYVNKY